jgi:hypothetical protein
VFISRDEMARKLFLKHLENELTIRCITKKRTIRRNNMTTQYYDYQQLEAETNELILCRKESSPYYLKYNPAIYSVDDLLHEDVLMVIFQYLPTSSLLNISLVSHRWFNAASHDQLWKCNYMKSIDTVQCNMVTHNYRSELIQHKRSRYEIESTQAYVKELTDVSKLLRHISLICPIFILLGCTFYSLLVPLFLDKSIKIGPKTHAFMLIPFILLVLIPFIIMFIAFSPIRYLMDHIKKSQEAKLQLLGNNVNDHTLSRHYFRTSDLLLRVIGLFAFIPIIGTCIYVRLAFQLYSIPYRVAISPFYLYTLIHASYNLIRNRKRFNIVSAAFQVYLCIQFSLIATKLDTGTSRYSHWILVMIPTWIIMSLIVSISPLCCAFGVLIRLYSYICDKNQLYGYKLNYCSSIEEEDTFFPESVSVMGTLFAVAWTPIIVWLLLFCLRLDGYVTCSYEYTWVPLQISLIIALNICICSRGRKRSVDQHL